MKINNNNGHTLTGLGTGAIGYLNESQETRNIGYYFVDGMKKLGHTVYDCTIDKSNTYLYEAVSKANKNKSDLAISHHLNCSDKPSANGVEVWVYSLNDKDTVNKAKKICEEISKLGFTNRGVKANPKFYWLGHTRDKAMIIEYCFCSNEKDYKNYNSKKLAYAVIKALTDVDLNNHKPTINNNSEANYKYSNGSYNAKATIVGTNGKGLNIRSERSSNSKILGQFKEGQAIEVNYCIDNWFSTWSNGSKGFVYGKYIKLD